MLPKTRIMNPALQMTILTKIFKKFNPSADWEEVDFDHIDPTCNFRENLGNVAEGNPQFVWKEPEDNGDVFNKNWSVQNIDGGQEFSTTTKVKLCKQGKYTYAKIQVTAPDILVGLKAYITIPKINPETKAKQAIPDSGLFDEFFPDAKYF